EYLGPFLLMGRSRRDDVPQVCHRREEAAPHRIEVARLRRQLHDAAQAAADCRNGIFRIERVTPGRGVRGGALGPQGPIGVKIIGYILGPGEGPLLLAPPTAAVVELALRRAASTTASHDEETHRRSLVYAGAVRPPGQPAVEETQLLLEVAAHAPDR